MPKQSSIEQDGTILEALSKAMFKIELELNCLKNSRKFNNFEYLIGKNLLI